MSDGHNKKDFAIILAANSKYLFALCEFLVNLQETNNDLYDNVIVYYCDITNEECRKIKKIENRVLFRPYSYEMFVKEHGEADSENGKEFIQRYSHLALARYIIFEQLEYYHKILYLDLDMLIRGDISELSDLRGIDWRDTIDDFKKKFRLFIGSDEYEHYIRTGYLPEESAEWRVPNGGLILITDDDGLDYRKCLSDGRDFISRFMNSYPMGIDEMALSYIAHKNNMNITSLPKDRYNTIPFWYGHDTKIVHFMIRDKPWKSSVMQMLFPEWMENYERVYNEYGISSTEVEKKEYCLGQILYSNTWTELFRDHDFVFPEGLKTDLSINSSMVRFYYSDKIYYYLKVKGMFQVFGTGIVIEDPFLLDNDEFISAIKNIKNTVFSSRNGSVTIMSDNDEIEMKDIKDIFYDFLKNVNVILDRYRAGRDNYNGSAK